MSFTKAGWYLVSVTADKRSNCRYYHNKNEYVATCHVESNGKQIFGREFNPPQKAPCLARYELMQSAPPGDWWDNPANSKGYGPKQPDGYSRAKRKPTAKELGERAKHADTAAANGLTCIKSIEVGIFFDGTNNNKERDRDNVSAGGTKSHSNVVSLYDAHKAVTREIFRYYIPGVGTPFRQVKEPTETSAGKSFAKGGEARILWAMLQVYNAVCLAATGAELLQEGEMTTLVTTKVDAGLSVGRRLGNEKTAPVFAKIQERLMKALEGARPTIYQVKVSVFGFSRGSAQARTFCNWLQRDTGGKIGTAALEMKFLGLFDTVASVGLADSSPVGRGFMDWATGTMVIKNIGKVTHYAAGHEIRRSFPLSTARDRGSWPANVSEFVYPGAHSDIGGGYSPGDQGKSVQGRPALLSQISLRDMYFEAANAGVPLNRLDELPADVAADFNIDASLDKAFNAYLNWTGKADEKHENLSGTKTGVVENRMQYQMQMYWRWRATKSKQPELTGMNSYQRASEQDKRDMLDANVDWNKDIARAESAHDWHEVLWNAISPGSLLAPIGVVKRTVIKPNPNEVQQALLEAVKQAHTVTPAVNTFFDEYVHDSHAGFWMLGPITKWDKYEFVKEIHDKQANYVAYKALAQKALAQANLTAAAAYQIRANLYQLNSFERRVLKQNPNRPPEVNVNQTPLQTPDVSMPTITDEDAADLRDIDPVAGFVVRRVMGSGTRREADGHGQYRNIFDDSVEFFSSTVQGVSNAWNATTDAVEYTGEKVVQGAQYTKDKVVEGAEYTKDKVVQGAEYAKDKIVEGAQYTKDKVVEGAQYTKDKVVEGAQYTKDKVIEGADYVGDKAVEGGNYLKKKAMDGAEYVEDGFESVGTWLGDTWTGASKEVSTWPGKIKEGASQAGEALSEYPFIPMPGAVIPTMQKKNVTVRKIDPPAEEKKQQSQR